MKYWIGVVSKEHVTIGVKAGIAQIGHGKRTGLARMKKGDWLIYYSPKISLDSNEKLQTFTALGQIIDDEIYQREVSQTFKPYRRDIRYKNTKDVSILPLINQLAFIKDKKHWGFMFRLGLFEISEKDFKLISRLMIVK